MEPLNAINLTSLLDVAFVLLIAFMLVAPSIHYGIDLALPTLREGAPQLTQDQTSLYTITVPKPVEGRQDFFMNDTPSELTDIESRLALQAKSGTKVAVEIRADRDVSYDTFIQVVAAVRRSGVESVGLPVEPLSVAPPSSSAAPAPTATKPTPAPAATTPATIAP